MLNISRISKTTNETVNNTKNDARGRLKQLGIEINRRISEAVESIETKRKDMGDFFSECPLRTEAGTKIINKTVEISEDLRELNNQITEKSNQTSNGNRRPEYNSGLFVVSVDGTILSASDSIIGTFNSTIVGKNIKDIAVDKKENTLHTDLGYYITGNSKIFEVTYSGTTKEYNVYITRIIENSEDRFVLFLMEL